MTHQAVMNPRAPADACASLKIEAIGGINPTLPHQDRPSHECNIRAKSHGWAAKTKKAPRERGPFAIRHTKDIEYYNDPWIIAVMDERNIVAALSALAHEHRLRIFRLLVRAGPTGVPSGAIAEHVGSSPTAISFHLKELENAQLLTSTRHGRFIHYAVRVEGMRLLLTYLTEDCCQGHPELCGGAVSKASAVCKPKGKVKCQ